MARLPRGICPVCGREVALRYGGRAREHSVPHPQGRAFCLGSGKKALEKEVNPP